MVEQTLSGADAELTIRGVARADLLHHLKGKPRAEKPATLPAIGQRRRVHAWRHAVLSWAFVCERIGAVAVLLTRA